MNATTRLLGSGIIVGLVSMAGLAACSRDAASDTGAQLAIAVKPLSLRGVGNAVYTVRVYSSDPTLGGAELVAEADELGADQYGDGVGSISYVIPCDASSPTNWVELTLNRLDDEGGGEIDADTYQNPTPLIKEADCRENRDTAVTFNITVMRDASQGFFDIAVDFSDVFCSAKLDCRDADGPIELLHDPATGERDTTMVLGFACTAGDGQTTWLHMSDVYVECDADGPGGIAPETFWLSPVGQQGNHGPALPVFFQTGLYMGEEQLQPYDKCYWNMAFGVSDNAPANCKLVVDATASEASWLGQNGRSPADTVYPFIHYEAKFTGAEGELVCGQHPMNGSDGVVSTGYTTFAGASFPFEWQCGAELPSETGRIECDGSLAALGPDGAVFTQTPGGVSAAFGAARTQAYGLPEGLTLGGCCLNPCCSEP